MTKWSKSLSASLTIEVYSFKLHLHLFISTVFPKQLRNATTQVIHPKQTLISVVLWTLKFATRLNL